MGCVGYPAVPAPDDPRGRRRPGRRRAGPRHRWLPEAARILRPGGRLVFLRTAVLLALCEPETGTAGGRLLRPLFGLHRLDWDDPEGRCAEFQLPHGELIRLLRRCGFVVEDLFEVQAPEGGSTGYPYVTTDWARQWPSEEVWFTRLTGPRASDI